MSHTAPYRHFRNKDDLLAAIAEEGFFRLTASLKRAATKDWQPFKRLHNAGVAFVEFALERPEELGVMFSIEWDEKLHPAAKAAAQGSFEALFSLVGACSRIGSTSRYDTMTAARIAWAHAHSMAEFAMRRDHGFKSKQEIVNFTTIATEALLVGIGCSLDD